MSGSWSKPSACSLTPTDSPRKSRRTSDSRSPRTSTSSSFVTLACARVSSAVAIAKRVDLQTKLGGVLTLCGVQADTASKWTKTACHRGQWGDSAQEDRVIQQNGALRPGLQERRATAKTAGSEYYRLRTFRCRLLLCLESPEARPSAPRLCLSCRTGRCRCPHSLGRLASADSSAIQQGCPPQLRA